jgi:energy-coupling factor transport system substrate-specific component
MSELPSSVSPTTSSARIATLALIPSAVAFNIALGTLVRTIKLPIYLDCIGGIVTTLLAGVWPGVIVAVVSQVISALATSPDFMLYTGTAVAMGLYAHVVGKFGGFRTLLRAGVCGLGMGVLSATVSAPITYWRGGVTSAGSSWVTAIFLGTHHPLLQSVVYSGITCDLPDKIVECIITVWLIRAVPVDLLKRFHGGTLEKNFTLTE